MKIDIQHTIENGCYKNITVNAFMRGGEWACFPIHPFTSVCECKSKEGQYFFLSTSIKGITFMSENIHSTFTHYDEIKKLELQSAPYNRNQVKRLREIVEILSKEESENLIDLLDGIDRLAKGGP